MVGVLAVPCPALALAHHFTLSTRSGITGTSLEQGKALAGNSSNDLAKENLALLLRVVQMG